MWPTCTWNRFSEPGIAGRRRWRKPGPCARSTKSRRNFPQMQFEHLLQMTDSTGVIQHATYSIPNFHEGYCLDDNARALVLTVLLEELGLDSIEIQRAATTYAAFLNYAFDIPSGRFRNFLELRSELARRCGVGRFGGPRGVGGRRVHRAHEAAGVSLVGGATVRAGGERRGANLVAARLGVRADRHSRIPASHERRSADESASRYAHRAADRAVSNKTRATTGRGSSPTCRTTMPNCRTR